MRLGLPLRTSLLRFFENSYQLVFLCRLCEILDLKKVFALLFGVSHSEVKPLLVAFCVGVDLHVKVILLDRNKLCCKQIPTFEHRVKDQGFVIVLSGHIFPCYSLIMKILVEIGGKLLVIAGAQEF
jgi:hypothetical protein